MKKITLSIPQPCHEDWNQMTAADKGRFCASCQKTVVDFTNMSDRQLAEFFKKPSASVCGRFQQEQLHRSIELPRKRIPWIKYFFQFTLPAFLLSMKANAQKNKTILGDTTYCTQTLGFVAMKPVEKTVASKQVSGQIVDAQGNKVPFATVAVKNTKNAVQADADGTFQINAEMNSILIISAVGYEEKEIVVKNVSEKITLSLNAALSGEVVVVGYAVRKKSKPIPLIKKVVDSAFKKFALYPNPVQRNSFVTLDFKKLDAGEYTVSIINISGEVVQTKDVNVENKKPLTELALKDIAAGTYFVQVFNRKTAASYSEKIIVQ